MFAKQQLARGIEIFLTTAWFGADHGICAPRCRLRWRGCNSAVWRGICGPAWNGTGSRAARGRGRGAAPRAGRIMSGG